jgi:hypothetical protein
MFVTLFSYVGLPTDSALSQTFDFVVRGRRHDLYAVLAGAERRFAETFLPPPAPRGAAGLPAVAADADLEFADLEFLVGRYAPTHGAGALLLARLGRVASAVGVEVIGSNVWIGGEGPLRHTGGGVLAASEGEARWLFTRTAQDVFLQRPTDVPFRAYVKKPWHWNATVTLLPLLLPILLAVPALLFGVVNRRSVPRRRLGYLLALAGTAGLVGLYFELESFAANYFPEGPTAALVAWRLLLNLAWLAAAAAAWTLVANPRELLGGVRSISSAARVLLVVSFAAAAAALLVLLPYWRLVGNFAGL